MLRDAGIISHCLNSQQNDAIFLESENDFVVFWLNVPRFVYFRSSFRFSSISTVRLGRARVYVCGVNDVHQFLNDERRLRHGRLNAQQEKQTYFSSSFAHCCIRYQMNECQCTGKWISFDLFWRWFIVKLFIQWRRRRRISVWPQPSAIQMRWEKAFLQKFVYFFPFFAFFLFIFISADFSFFFFFNNGKIHFSGEFFRIDFHLCHNDPICGVQKFWKASEQFNVECEQKWN